MTTPLSTYKYIESQQNGKALELSSPSTQIQWLTKRINTSLKKRKETKKRFIDIYSNYDSIHCHSHPSAHFQKGDRRVEVFHRHIILSISSFNLSFSTLSSSNAFSSYLSPASSSRIIHNLVDIDIIL